MSDHDLLQLDGRHERRRIGRHIVVLESAASTNDVAADRCRGLPREDIDGLTVLAHHQPAGRGTRGRRWWSPAGASLPMSVVLAPSHTIAEPAALTLAGAVAVVKAAERFGATTRIKWPNDVVDETGAKLSGVLGEALPTSPASYVLGIGVNVFPPDEPRPADLAAAPSNLVQAGASIPDRAVFCLALLDALEAEFATLWRLGPGPLVQDVEQRSWLRGRTVTLRRGNDQRTVVFQALTPDLELLLVDSAGDRLRWPAAQVVRVDESA